MDETKETQGVATSEDTKGTSEKEPETFTKEQVVERERKAKSDVSAELGRVRKLNEDLIKSSQAIQERLEARDREEVERELETHRDEPAEIRRIRAEQETRRVKSELTKKEQELDVEKAKTAEAQEAEVKSTKERNAREVATRLGVDAKTLTKFTDGSVEAMEELAKSLPKKGEAKTLTPDSGKTSGGGKTYKSEEILKTLDPSTMTPQQISEKVKELAEAEREGRIK